MSKKQKSWAPELTVASKVLAEALKRAASMTGGQSIPILSCVKMTRRGPALELETTNLDQTLTQQIPVEWDMGASEGWVACLPAKKLASLVAAMPTGELDLQLTPESRLRVRAGGSSVELCAADAGEIPLTGFETVQAWEIAGAKLPGDVLRTAVGAVQWAMSNDISRYVLNGVLLDFAEDELRVVATNGRALARTVVDLPEGWAAAAGRKTIVPTSGLTRLLPLLDGEVRVWINDKMLCVRSDAEGWLFSTRLVEGTYPNYEQVIPRQPGTPYTLDAKEWEGAFKRLALLDTGSEAQITLKLGGGKAVLTRSCPDVGEAEDIILTETPHPAELIFNAAYFVPALRASGGATALELRGNGDPSTVTAGRTMAVIMPIKLV